MKREKRECKGLHRECRLGVRSNHAAQILFLSGFKWTARIFNGLGVDISGFIRVEGIHEFRNGAKSEQSRGTILPRWIGSVGAAGVFIITGAWKRGDTPRVW
jgi:hypothetical protein